jgi:SAM-dependent methyltransferase
MDRTLQSLFVCPHCQSKFSIQEKYWVCSKCGFKVNLIDDKPIFTPVPREIIPTEKQERGPHSGSRWRQANWDFLEKQVKRLDEKSTVLDVGAGHGDFQALLKHMRYVAVDVYPYPEINVVCDFTSCMPLKKQSVDVAVLMNLCEHVYHPQTLLSKIRDALKPHGMMILTIPFMLKIHQAPLDFARYTHYALERMATEVGFQVEVIEGFYDSAGMIAETERYFRFWQLPQLSKFKRMLARLSLGSIRLNNFFLQQITGKGKSIHPSQCIYPAPTGYQMVWRKHSKRGEG